MELRAYLRFFRKRWWIILSALVLTLAATVVITLRTPPVYQTTASYIVGVSSTAPDEKSRISALDLLSNRNEVAGTYAKIANSRTIKLLAAQQLGLDSLDNLSVSSQIVSGSNVLEVTVEGRDPGRVRDFANAVGDQTAKYVQDLSESYELRPLDKAVAPRSPISPRMTTNLMLGAILGLALGLALAALAEYMQTPMESGSGFNILDQRSGAFNMSYFMLRLQQEMSRAKRNGRSLSLALLNIDHGDFIGRTSPQLRMKALRAAAAIVGPSLRNEDIMASQGDVKIAILLPDANHAAAEAKVAKLIEKLSLSPLELDGTGSVVNLRLAAGIASYRRQNVGEEKTAEELLAEAEQALRESESATYGGIAAESSAKPAENLVAQTSAQSTD